jgi:hypothetical protein
MCSGAASCSVENIRVKVCLASEDPDLELLGGEGQCLSYVAAVES